MLGLSRKRLIRIAGARQHDKGQSTHDILPAPPSRQLRQDIGPHDPDEANTREAAQQQPQCVDRVACTECRLDPAGNNAPPVRETPSAVQAFCERRHATGGFQRIAGRDQEPNLVQTKVPTRQIRHMPMPGVGRIERAPQQSHADPPSIAKPRQRPQVHRTILGAHFRDRNRQGPRVRPVQGRTCPVPIT